MIVVDKSAVVAIAFGEPERPTFIEAILHADNKKRRKGVRVIY